VLPASYEGKERGLGSADEKTRQVDAKGFEAMIPQEHKDFIGKVLKECEVPPLPECVRGGAAPPTMW
jgi:hypothetical protein